MAYVWGKWQQDVIQYDKEWYILCFAYKWLGEKKTHVIALPDFSLYKKEPYNDRELVKKLHELFNEADIIVAHNGDSFDQKKSQARMLYHGFAPPSPYKQIDTKKVARKYFNMNSNKLDDIGKYLSIGSKLQTGGFDTWLGCMNGDSKAWKKMTRYNVQDVKLLEEVYIKLRPWITNHPSVSLLEKKPDACPKCGGGPVQRRGFRAHGRLSYKQQYQCMACKGWLLGRPVERTDTKYVS